MRRKKQRKRLGHGERNRARQSGKDYIDWAKEIKKNLKTQFCRQRLSNSFLLVSTKSKMRIQKCFSFYFFTKIRRKEDEEAFSISTKKSLF